jgi:Dihydrouridine synthase (Dus)
MGCTASFATLKSVNCGRPQHIAQKGQYGDILLKQEDILLNLIRLLVPHLHVPLSLKVRLLPPPDTGSGIHTRGQFRYTHLIPSIASKVGGYWYLSIDYP